MISGAHDAARCIYACQMPRDNRHARDVTGSLRSGELSQRAPKRARRGVYRNVQISSGRRRYRARAADASFSQRIGVR